MGRIEGLSDAVFGVAMTLLVLEIKEPEFHGIVTEMELAAAFWELMPKFLLYFLSFMTTGIFWTGQATQLRYIKKRPESERDQFVVSTFCIGTAVFYGFSGRSCLFQIFNIPLLAEHFPVGNYALIGDKKQDS